MFVGSCVTLSQLITFLQENSTKSTSFEHLADHLAKIANVPVRNVSRGKDSWRDLGVLMKGV